MRTLVRRFVLLTTLLALLLGVMGATAPAALAGHDNDSNGTWVNGINVDATTIPQLQRLMDRGRLSSVDLVKFYLRRIHKLNPKLNAVITVSPTALKDARAADRERRHGNKHDGALHWGGGGSDHGSLLGIPVIVKDNIDTTGMPTTAGSWALAGSSPRDAFIVKRLKAAGAIVIAKANLSEWANFRSNPSSSGWSGIGGQTNMAYVLDRNPCGSSSGTGVAVSADLATVGVGTETDGSVVCPSGANGLVGIKPTLGLLSRTGIVPITADQDTAGPMARNVTDAAVLLGAMTGIDRKDAATAAQAGHARRNYTRFLDKNALKGARIGVWREGTYDKTISPEIEAMMNATVATLKAQGATIVDPARILIEPAYGPEFEALLCEFKSDVASYLQANTRHRYPKTLQDLIDFNKAHPELEGPWGSELFEQAQATGGRADPACTAARTLATSTAKAAIDDLMAANDLDAIIAPTNGAAWVTDPVKGDLSGDFSKFVGSSSPSAIAGYPDITVPAAFVGPLPLGVTFIGGRWDEPELISLAYAFEQATHVRVPPMFLATTAFPATVASSTNVERKAVAPDRDVRSRMPALR
jgi:amidase